MVGHAIGFSKCVQVRVFSEMRKRVVCEVWEDERNQIGNPSKERYLPTLWRYRSSTLSSTVLEKHMVVVDLKVRETIRRDAMTVCW